MINNQQVSDKINQYKMATTHTFNSGFNKSNQFQNTQRPKESVFFKESKPAPYSRTFHSQWREKNPRPFSFQGEDEFANTACKVSSANFQHHNPDLCVCEDCTCGRHLCQLHVVKPILSKSSNYKNSYNRKHPIPNNVNHDKEYLKLNGPHIGMDSGYNKNYPGRQGDKTQRPHPEDLLKTGGPSPNLTSYNSGFPGYKGGNQYVKPKDEQTRGNFPLMSRTTYGKSFSSNKPTTKPVKQKLHDNLKTGNLWLGQTSYGNNYKQPNPEDFAKKYKMSDKLQKNPNFGRQYETTYKNHFLGEKKEVCPAKTKLQTKLKGGFTSVKDRFTENSDFKSLSPQFHAISTSKHSYV